MGYIMKQGIAIAGNLIVDYVKLIDTFPGQGMLCNITDRSKCIGGCAANTSACLAALDSSLPLYCFGSVGGDEDGNYVTARLAEMGICTDGIVVKHGAMTSFTDVMAVKNSGERTFFHARGANAVFGPADIDFERIRGVRHFHMGYVLLLDEFDKPDPDFGTVMARTLKRVQEMGVKTSLDVVSEDGERFAQVVKPSLRYCDYFIANEIESGRIAGIQARTLEGCLDQNALRAICTTLFEYDVKEWIVIHAPEGGAAMTRDGSFFFQPSLALPADFIKGSVGAGDAFCAGILYGIYSGCSVEEALKTANAAAAANLSEADSVSGLRSYEKVMEFIETYGWKPIDRG